MDDDPLPWRAALTGPPPGSWLLVLAGLLAGAGFAAAEVALLRLGRRRARQLAEGGGTTWRLAAQLIADPRRLLAALLAALTLTLYGAQALATDACLSGRHGSGVVLLLLPLATVLGLGLLPSLLAVHRPELIARLTTPAVWLALRALQPLLTLMDRVATVIARGLGARAAEVHAVTEDDIREAVAHAEATGALEREERMMIHAALNFDAKCVREVMVPLDQVVALPQEAGVARVVALVVESEHSRIPLYDGDPRRITGLVYAKDLLRVRQAAELPAHTIARTPITIPAHTPVPELLNEFQRRRRLMAVVIDDHGEAIGVVTLEDVLEELVGEILDEHDEDVA